MCMTRARLKILLEHMLLPHKHSPNYPPLYFNSKQHSGQINKLLGNKYNLRQRVASAAKKAEQSRGVAVIVRSLQANMLTQI